ncbi:hypothetical protein PCANC_25392, partial [Puccinia coronata f. sp. avenae]
SQLRGSRYFGTLIRVLWYLYKGYFGTLIRVQGTITRTLIRVLPYKGTSTLIRVRYPYKGVPGTLIRVPKYPYKGTCTLIRVQVPL